MTLVGLHQQRLSDLHLCLYSRPFHPELVPIDAYNAGSIKDAHDAFYEVSDNEEKMAMWSMLKPFSKLRSAVKTYHEQREQYNGQAG